MVEGLSPEEAEAMEAIDKIPMGFKIRSNGRREDSDGTETLPVEQPAQILPDVRLYIGDIDDAADIEEVEKTEH